MSAAAKLKLWTAGTPNGHKCSIYLEELAAAYGLKYDFQGLSFSKNEQKEEPMLQRNPNGRIPFLTDYNYTPAHEVFESASVNLWLAENYDKKNLFWFDDPLERSEAMSWVFWMHGGLGPMQGQANHFNRYAPEKIPYAINRYIKETERLYSVIEDRLAGKREHPIPEEGHKPEPREYLVGKGKGKYSLADINIFPWVRMYFWAGVEDLSQFPHLKSWMSRIEERDAVKKGIDVPEKSKYNPNDSKEEHEKQAKEASKWIMQDQKK